MARSARVPSITASQAKFVLEKVIDEGKVSAADVRRHLARMWEEMSTLEKRIAELRSMTSVIKHPIHEAKIVVKIRRRQKAASPDVAASRNLQGQYLGYLRQIPKTARNRFQQMAKTKGREEAISAMKKHLEQ